jgi:hypothetical protein
MILLIDVHPFFLPFGDFFGEFLKVFFLYIHYNNVRIQVWTAGFSLKYKWQF